MNRPEFLQKIHSRSIHLLGLTGIMLVISLLFFMSVLIGANNTYQLYHSTEVELKGIHAINHLSHAMDDLQQIRTLLFLNTVTGTAEFEKMLAVYKIDIIQDLSEDDWPELRDYFQIEDRLTVIIKQVSTMLVSDIVVQGDINSHVMLTNMIDEIHDLILVVGDRAHLTLDPQIDTYYLSELIIKHIPYVSKYYSEATGYGAVLIAQMDVTSAERDTFLKNIFVTQNSMERFRHAISVVVEKSPALGESLLRELNDLGQEVDVYMQYCKNYPCKIDTTITAMAYYESLESRRGSLRGIYNDVTETLEHLVSLRLSGHRSQLIIIIISTLIALSIICLCAAHFYRKLRGYHEELESMSLVDSLTKIPNRRLLHMIFDREIGRARRYGLGLAFGMIDVDNFKKYNDHYGHLQGDVALTMIAGKIKENLQRASDYFFRYGGEEFCFLINAETLNEVETVCEKIRTSIAGMQILHLHNCEFNVITVSTGVVFTRKIECDALEAFIEYSDGLLYQAKKQGRNRTVAEEQNRLDIAADIAVHDNLTATNTV